jgi:hypothetical protein
MKESTTGVVEEGPGPVEGVAIGVGRGFKEGIVVVGFVEGTVMIVGVGFVEGAVMGGVVGLVTSAGFESSCTICLPVQ